MSEKVSKNQQPVISKGKLKNQDEFCDNHKIPAKVQIEQTEMFSGPLPPPTIMAGYENVLPGSADRIIAMAEKEQQHRHKFENKCQKNDSRDSVLGICAAFIITLCCEIGGINLITNTNHNIIGSFLTGFPILGLAGSFLSNTKATWKIKKDKAESSNSDEHD